MIKNEKYNLFIQHNETMSELRKNVAVKHINIT